MVYSGEKGFSLRFGSFWGFFGSFFFVGGCFWGGGVKSFFEMGLMIVGKMDRTLNSKKSFKSEKKMD